MQEHIQRAILCGILVSSSSACFFESPIDPDASVPVDFAVLGTWRCLGFDEGPDANPANFVVSRAGNHRYSILLQEDDDEADQLDGHASVVKGQTILNVRVPKAKVPVKPWTLARYSFLRPDVLHVQVVDESKLKGADTSPESLRRALEKLLGQPDLFGNYCVCVRVKT